jgi:hypothetical protein
LRGLCQDIVELRRGDHSGARLNLEQEWLEPNPVKPDQTESNQMKKLARSDLCNVTQYTIGIAKFGSRCGIKCAEKTVRLR